MRIPPVERLLAMLGYVPFLWWVPIVAKRDSMFCQFHGRQAGVLWSLWFVPIVVMIVLAAVFQAVLIKPPVDQFYFGGMVLLSIIYLLMSLIGFVKAGIRERYRMPVVADVALLLRL
jgi:uncharacterized membrane protein